MSDTLRAIGDELNSVATAVTTARETYNQRAATYNRAIGVLPGNLIAGMAGFHRAENF
jgi:hypothetical protein